jgi:LDH2 family malate/lactate/ureidoglycolate dehydrogenase
MAPRSPIDHLGAVIPRSPDAFERIRALGFGDRDARTIADHFLDADARGKTGHGVARIDFLATLPGLDPSAQPARVISERGYERWDGCGAVGYLTLAAICDSQLAAPPERARLVVASRCFPTGHLGYWARRLATGGLVALLTATSPPRLAHPEGGPALAGTNPLAIGIPSSDGRPLVSDVSMGRVTHGDVLAGLAPESDLVPFGGEHAHKAFALAIGLQAFVDALGVDDYGAALVVARPETDPVPGLRARGAGVRLPGDRLVDSGA